MISVNGVQSPNQTVANQTVGDVWDKHIATMGSGSDFTAFQDFAGIPCIDMGFGFSANSPIYQYHSNYDSFAWMSKFGDPGFHYHETIARAWALLVAKLVESPVLRLNATDYAQGLKTYLESVKAKARDSVASDTTPLSEIFSVFKPLDKAIDKLRDAAVSFDAHAAELSDELASGIPWWKWWKRVRLYYRVRRVNTKYKYLERQFLYEKGLDGRSWFKHVVFAPGLWTGYAGATFPGLVESIENGDKRNANKWVRVITGLVQNATALLEE
jgi:N-acetylated-alpha-linked acidic dipeptidase